MLPIPAATTTLANMQGTSIPVFGAFIPYGYMEIGLILGALAIVFIIGIIADIPAHLRAWFAHNSVRKFDSPVMHRDTTASSAAIREHNRFKSILRGGSRISRYD